MYILDSLQVRAPTDSRLIFRSPANCDPSTCDIFVGIDTNTGNPGFLDIYMEGNAQGWVAVGFSDSPNMVGILIIFYSLTLHCTYYNNVLLSHQA